MTRAAVAGLLRDWWKRPKLHGFERRAGVALGNPASAEDVDVIEHATHLRFGEPYVLRGIPVLLTSVVRSSCI